MPGLFSSLYNAGGALEAFSRVLEVTQNNVANANTPGYARQTQRLYAMAFDPHAGAAGGVRAGEVESARDAFAEYSVRRETASLGLAQQKASSLSGLESLFDISGESGLPYALNNLFRSFSAWAQSPGDAVARQTVIERAADVAQSFRQTAAGLGRVASEAASRLRDTVDQVNRLAANLADYNRKGIEGASRDAGLQAQVNATLEELAQYVDFTTVQQDDGSVSVLIDGQVPLVLESQQFGLSFDLYQPQDPPPVYLGAPPSARIVSQGRDITDAITSGSLGALLDLRNRVLPSYMGDARQAGDLNLLAKQFAGRVNGLLTGGYIADGDPPETGVPLFVYDTENDTAVAQTLSIDSGVTADRLAAIDPGPPAAANGIPLRLSSLASPESAEDEIGGASFAGFYGQMAARAGSELSAARDDEQVQQSAVAQAQSLRQQMSGVSLDEEAMILVEFQRAYQANSRLISVLDQLTEETINILQG
ncbi:MAG: flagellar hook-associated protein FlgK [Acidobacteriia bacterium]|nr:flagellar hook-associated protein FlgK [Terriglobia bacterium]